MGRGLRHPAALLPEVFGPPFSSIGALTVDTFLSKKSRKDLAAGLNTLLAAPSFASWRQGVTLDVGAWMEPDDEAAATQVGDVVHAGADDAAGDPARADRLI